MAVVKEEEEEKKELRTKTPPKRTETAKPQKPSLSQKDPKPHSQNPFTFWFHFTVLISLITLVFVSISSLSNSQDPKSWFLSLPHALRQHYSSGRVIKVQINPNQSPIEVFVAENGPLGSENVVFVHGLGLSSFAFRDTIRSLGSKGVRVVAVDLPGNGFSDKSVVVTEEDKVIGPFGRFKEVYTLIRDKGVFWAFDQVVETGEIPYEEIMKLHASNRKSVKSIELGSEEIGRVLGQTIDTMNLAPVHLVLHDFALGMASNWVYENSESIRSVTLIDTGSKPALPIWVLNVPVIREIVLGFSFAFKRLATLCCSNGISLSEIDAQRILLSGRNGRRAIVGIAKKLNHSFDVAEWGSSNGIRNIPMQVIWAKEWSKEWSDEGGRVAAALPQAKFIAHSGGRWPQEAVAGELAENIARFVSSLPESVRQVKEERISEHIQKLLEEVKTGDHHHGHHHDAHDHHHGHGHDQGAGYMDAYGLGHGWAA